VSAVNGMAGQDRQLEVIGEPSAGLAGILLAFAGGIALGWLAWGEGRAPALAALLPILVALAGNRPQAFAIGAGYALGVLRYTPAFIGGWFDGSLLVGGAALATFMLVSGFVWCLGWSSSSRPWRRALAIMVASGIALMPPAAIAVPGHPMIAWGSILPGSGWSGVAASFILPAAFIMAHQALSVRVGAAKALVLVLVIACALVALGYAQARIAPSVGPSGIVAVTTHWGKTGDTDDVLRRIIAMGEMSERLAQSHQPTVVIWPESIIGRYDKSLYPWFVEHLLEPAVRDGQTHVVGIDLPLAGGLFENAAVAFYPDGSSAVAVARQPAPLSLWRPWRTSETFVADWTANNILVLNNGLRAALIFCYEEYMPILYLINELRDRPDVYIALANTWAERNPVGAQIQSQHSLGIARLFGRPYVKAENRPLATSGQQRLP